MQGLSEHFLLTTNATCTHIHTHTRARARFFSLWHKSPTRVTTASSLRFLDHTQWHTTVCRPPLVERSARRKDLYLTTHNHKRQTDMHAPGGTWTCNPSNRSAADPCLRRSATGIGTYIHTYIRAYIIYTYMHTYMHTYIIHIYMHT